MIYIDHTRYSIFMSTHGIYSITTRAQFSNYISSWCLIAHVLFCILIVLHTIMTTRVHSSCIVFWRETYFVAYYTLYSYLICLRIEHLLCLFS